jgi:hypothetical protein
MTKAECEKLDRLLSEISAALSMARAALDQGRSMDARRLIVEAERKTEAVLWKGAK